MTGNRGDWIQTYSGIFYPFDPRPEEVNIEDIAHSLSLLCRYGGHTQRFYSVAEHCYLLSTTVHGKNALAALLHDAAEAYLGDVVRPLKRRLHDYMIVEARVERTLFRKFGVKFPLPIEVKEHDTRILVDERKELMAAPPKPWLSTEKLEPLGVRVAGWDPPLAEEMYLDRFRELTGA